MRGISGIKTVIQVNQFFRDRVSRPYDTRSPEMSGQPLSDRQVAVSERCCDDREGLEGPEPVQRLAPQLAAIEPGQ